MTEILRTPDDRFANLPDYPYTPVYADATVGGLDLRLARVDEGDGDAVVLVHGEPTWGFLYRKLLPPMHDVGLRTVVPDLPGFGRSDKPADLDWFTYDRLLAAFTAHVDAAGLTDPFSLVVHDWGGVIGLRWAVEHPDRIARLVILDTALYAPGGTPSEAWQAFRGFVEKTQELPIGHLVNGGAATDLPAEVVAAYEAPFHEPAAQAGARALPLLVPLTDDDPGAMDMYGALQKLKAWSRPTLVLWGEDDQILVPKIGRRFADSIPGCVGMEAFTPASHFLQEDVGEQLGQRIGAFVTGG